MNMKKIAIACALGFSANAAFGAVSATASITCGAGTNQFGYGFEYSSTPTINVTLNTGADAGKPGLFWLGVLTPDQQTALVLPLNGRWEKYQGGLYPPQSRYDNGLPSTISLQIPVPSYDPENGQVFNSSPTTTAQYIGYSVYVGHGALDSKSLKLVADRRAYLDSIREERIAQGRWSHHYDSDDQYKWALAQKDMTDSNKWGAVLSIPFINCQPDDQGG